MILYRLKCGNGHAFDAWFAGAADCDARLASGGVACPECGSKAVAKAVMAPRIAAARAEAAPCCEGPACPCCCGGGDACPR